MDIHCKSQKSKLNKIDDVITFWWCQNHIILGIHDLKERPNTCPKNYLSSAGSIMSSSFMVPEIKATQDWWSHNDIIKELKPIPNINPKDYCTNTRSMKSFSITAPMITTKQD